MSTSFNHYWLEPGAVVPVDIETTATLLRRVQDDTALLRQALEFFEHTAVKHPSQIAPRDYLVAALRERLGETK